MGKNKNLEDMYDLLGKDLSNFIFDVFENEDISLRWFYSSKIALNGETPADYCKKGQQDEVRRLLDCIKNGIFS